MATRMKAWHVIERNPKFPLRDISNVEKFSIGEAKELEKTLKDKHAEAYAILKAERDALIEELRVTDPTAIAKLEPIPTIVVTREWY